MSKHDFSFSPKTVQKDKISTSIQLAREKKHASEIQSDWILLLFLKTLTLSKEKDSSSEGASHSVKTDRRQQSFLNVVQSLIGPKICEAPL